PRSICRSRWVWCMLSTGDDSDPRTGRASTVDPLVKHSMTNVEFAEVQQFSLSKIGAALAQRRKFRNHARLIDGRTHLSSRTRAPSFNNSRSRWRRGSVSQVSRATDGTLTRLLSEAFGTNWARYRRSGGPPARGIDRSSHASTHL